MTSVITIKKCGRETDFERAKERESLDNLITSGEHGELIGTNVSTIIKNRAVIAEQAKSKVPNQKIISRANENIQICITIIESRLARLSAKPDEIAAVLDGINKADYQSITLTVLKVMARKNPGMHQRKYDQALKMIAAKNKQH